MKTEMDYLLLQTEILIEFPNFKIVDKNSSSLMKMIDVILFVMTAGQMKSFMQSFVTTLGTTVYVPQSWNMKIADTKMIVLRHERVHMRQSQKHGRFLYSFMYLFFPLPMIFANCRKVFEQEAYTESLKAIQEYHGNESLNDPILQKEMVAHFTSAQYFWTWPWKKSIERWYDTTIQNLLDI